MKALVLAAKWEPRLGYKVSEFEKRTGKRGGRNKRLAPPKLELGDWPQPKPGPGEVLLRVRAWGVCGSDVHFYETDGNWYMLYPSLTKFPTVIGHEFAG